VLDFVPCLLYTTHLYSPTWYGSNFNSVNTETPFGSVISILGYFTWSITWFLKYHMARGCGRPKNGHRILIRTPPTADKRSPTMMVMVLLLVTTTMFFELYCIETRSKEIRKQNSKIEKIYRVEERILSKKLIRSVDVLLLRRALIVISRI